MTTREFSAAEQWAALNVLTEQRCRNLLGERRWGRLALHGADWPTILPVNFGFDGENIVVKTSPGSSFAKPHLIPVAFEIDGVDDDGAWGWSVVVHGAAIDVTDSLDPTNRALRAMPLQTFAPGKKERWVRIAATQISGRSFGDVPDWD